MTERRKSFSLGAIVAAPMPMAMAAIVAVALLAVLAAQADAPCCTIKAIDKATATVTAVDKTSGQEFQFKVTDAALLNHLKVGQGIYANLKRRLVSLDGRTTCCRITGATAGGGMQNARSAATAASSRPGGKSAGDKSSGSLEIPSTFPSPTPGSGGFTLDPEKGEALVRWDLRKSGVARCSETVTISGTQCQLRSSSSDGETLTCHYLCPDIEKK